MTTTIEELATLPAPHETDTPVTRNPTIAERGTEHTIYVTSTEQDRSPELVGTFQTGMASWASEGWIHQSGVRMYGAPVDTTPVDGRHYRVLGAFAVRYNDALNVDARNHADHPFSIVAGIGTAPWPIPNDSILSLENTHYVEVEWEASTGRQEDGTAAVDNSDGGVILGLGKADDGVVALDPERVAGRQYLIWAGDGQPGDLVTLATWLPGTGTAGGWHVEGRYLRSGDGAVLRFSTDGYRLPEGGTLHWAELALADAEPADADAATALRAELRRKLSAAESEWESFDEALNELATDKGWCEEFEEIVKPFGLSGRTSRYDVEVEVSFTLEDDSPSADMDERLSNQYGLTLESTSITIEAKATITLYGLTLRDPGSASDDISTSDVEDALDNQISGISVSSVNDWTVVDWSTSED